MPVLEKVKTTGSTFNNQGLTIREDDKEKIILSLIKTYSSPITPIRETVINGLEVSDKVKVTITTNKKEENYNLLGSYTSANYSNGVITIEDYGEGMSEDFVRNFLLGVGASTKDEDDTKTGGFGIDAKSVLSITEQANWKTTHNGITTVMVLSLDDNKTSTFINSFPSDLPNGTIVTIPVNGETITRILDRMNEEYFDYVNPERVEVIVDNEPIKVGKYKVWEYDDGDIINDIPVYGYDTIKIIGHGGIPYDYKLYDFQYKIEKEMKYRKYNNPTDKKFSFYIPNNCAIRFDVPKKFINPNRESLEQSDKLDSFIIEKMADLIISKIDEYIDLVESLYGDKDAISNMMLKISRGEYNSNTLVRYDFLKDLNIYSFVHFFDEKISLEDIHNKSIILPKNNERRTGSVNDNIIGSGYRRSKYFKYFEKEYNLIDYIQKNHNVIGYYRFDSDFLIKKDYSCQIAKFLGITNDELFGIIKELFDTTIISPEKMKKEVYKLGKEVYDKSPDKEKTVAKEPVKDPIYILNHDIDDSFDTVSSLRNWVEKQSYKMIICLDIYSYDKNNINKYLKEKLSDYQDFLFSKDILFIAGNNVFSRFKTSMRGNDKIPIVKHRTSFSIMEENCSNYFNNKMRNLVNNNSAYSINYILSYTLSMIFNRLEDDLKNYYLQHFDKGYSETIEKMINHDELDLDNDVLFTKKEVKDLFYGLVNNYNSYVKDFWKKVEMVFKQWVKNHDNEDKDTFTIDELVEVFNKSKKVIDILEEI